jgi:hypothetical protein
VPATPPAVFDQAPSSETSGQLCEVVHCLRLTINKMRVPYPIARRYLGAGAQEMARSCPRGKSNVETRTSHQQKSHSLAAARKRFQFGLPSSRPIDLPLRMSIELGDRPIDQVYFVEQGFASVVTNGSKKRSMEVGLIGREGVTGLAVITGSDQTPNETYMQHAGAGQRITSACTVCCLPTVTSSWSKRLIPLYPTDAENWKSVWRAGCSCV